MRILFATPMLLAACQQPGPDPAPGPSPTPTPAAVATSSPLPSATATPAAAPALTADGWGAMRIGMTRRELEAAFGPDADPEAVGGPDPESCDQFRPVRAPKGLVVMVEDGRLTRVSLVEGATLRTDRGLGLGATAAEVRAAHGAALAVEPHEYVPPPGENLTHWARGGAADRDARGVRYEIGADGRVSAVHAGGRSIGYAEGCA